MARVNKHTVKVARDKLMARVSEIGGIDSREWLVAELKKTSGFDPVNSSAGEIRTMLLQWAVRDALDFLCE